MARGKRTEPTQAILVQVMGEMGFEQGLISQVVRLPRGTVKDIIQGNGSWASMPENDLSERLRLRLTQVIDSVADNLALKAMAKVNEKIESGSFRDSLAIMDVLMRKGD